MDILQPVAESPARDQTSNFDAPQSASPHRADRSSDDRSGALLARVSAEVGEERFRKFFDRQTRVEMHGGRVDVTVPTGFLADLLGRRFGDSLRRAAGATLGESDPTKVDLQFHVDGGAFGSTAPAASPPAPKAASRPGDSSVAPARSPGQTPRRKNDHALRHRFEDFIVGESNKLAHAAARRLAEGEDLSLTGPVFIHGSCGLGKTHLLQAAAVRFLELRPRAVVRYTTAEAFTNEFITSVRTSSVDAFRRIYRGVDLLCIDDVHFLSNKDATQRELLHTFDAIGIGGARVALVSDEHPRDIRKLSQQLVSRFVSGAVVRVDPPEPILRGKIVRQVASRRGMILEDAAVQLLSDRSARGGASVREIEGMLSQIEATLLVRPELAPRGSIGLALVHAALGMGSSTDAFRIRRPIPLAQILAEVCRRLGVDQGELLGKGRHKSVVLGREMTVYVCRKLTTCSFPEIARAMGRSNHSTVLTAHKRLETQIALGGSPRSDLPPEFAGLTLAELAAKLTNDVQRASA